MWLFVTKEPLHPNPPAIPSVTQTHPPPQWIAAVNQARSAIQSGMSGQSLPAVSVAVGAEGSLIWSEAFGWADIENRTPATPDTRFRMGSASTALTSAAVGILLEQGRLKLDDEIQTYVPQFPRKQQGPLTLRQLMAHTGGVETGEGDEGAVFRQRCEQPLEALPYFANANLRFEPGTRYERADYGWILVSAAVQAAGQRPFAVFMKEQVFQPLGMDATGAESTAEENPERMGEPAEDPPPATLIRHFILKPFGIGARLKPASTNPPPAYYSPGFGHDPLVRYGLHIMRSRNLSCYAGSLAFLSTPSDLVRFGLAMNGAAAGHKPSLLRPATITQLQTSYKLASGRETGHGLGWDLHTVTLNRKPTAVASSNGELLAAKMVSIMILRETGIVVAVAANASHADPVALAVQVAEAFSSKPANGNR